MGSITGILTSSRRPEFHIKLGCGEWRGTEVVTPPSVSDETKKRTHQVLEIELLRARSGLLKKLGKTQSAEERNKLLEE